MNRPLTDAEWLEIRAQLAELAKKVALDPRKKKPSLPQNCALPQMDEDKESA